MTIPFTDDHANYIMRLQERISELEQRLEYNQNYTKALITENNEVIKQLVDRDSQLKVAQEALRQIKSAGPLDHHSGLIGVAAEALNKIGIEGSTTNEIVTELHRLNDIIEAKDFRINKLEALKGVADKLLSDPWFRFVDEVCEYIKASKELDNE